jgi:hypothetical protein
MVVYCHVVIFAETMDRDLEKEEALENIIRAGGDRVEEEALSFLNDNDGGIFEEEGDHDHSNDGRLEEEQDHDGSGDREKEDLTVAESGEVYIYILIKPLLTRCINCFLCTYIYINASFFF